MITLIPVIGIVQVGGQAMADRYTLSAFTRSFPYGRARGSVGCGQDVRAVARTAGEGGGRLITVIAAVPLIYLTTQQLEIWKNSLIFWQYIIKKEPGVPTAYNGLGVELIKWDNDNGIMIITRRLISIHHTVSLYQSGHDAD